MSKLFSAFKLREVEFRNRIFVSPMCQYSCVDGVANTWHMVHLGSRAVGGAGLVMVEATGVSAEGRISPGDMGLWNQTQCQALKSIATFIKEQGAVPAVQLAHAGRKGSTRAPFDGHGPLDPKLAWTPIAPSAVKFSAESPQPREMNLDDLKRVRSEFLNSAKLAREAGFEVIEIHMAHGYLLHEFLSPLSNLRKDDYGGALESRMRFPLEVAQDLRSFWPQNLPVFVRISATDWADGGWDLEQSIALSHELKKIGIDLIDCSSGGLVEHAKIPVGPNYQVPFAEKIRQKVGLATGAVGLITEAHQAEEILTSGKADVVSLARAFLADPYWPLHAAEVLGEEIYWPKQYLRGKKR